MTRARSRQSRSPSRRPPAVFIRRVPANLGRRVAYQTESQSAGARAPSCAPISKRKCSRPLPSSISPAAWWNPPAASRRSWSPSIVRAPQSPTVLIYGHGDVVDGMVGEWRGGLDPWRTTKIDNRVYGRGTADNKGQHSINLAALRAVREARGGKLGFNAKFIDRDGRGDRLAGSRHGLRVVARRAEGRSVHGLRRAAACRRIARPSSSAAAAASAFISTSTCARAGIIPAIGAACSPIPRPSSPTPSRRWSTAMDAEARRAEAAAAHQPDSRSCLPTSRSSRPQDEPALVGELGRGRAVGGRTALRLEHAGSAGDVGGQYRQAGQRDSRPGPRRAATALRRRHQIRRGRRRRARAICTATAFRWSRSARRRALPPRAPISTAPGSNGRRTRSGRPPERRRRCCRISAARCRTTCFPKTLGLPTIWVPHSYPGCSQHAPDEHILLSVTEEALGIMAGLFWDLGEIDRARRSTPFGMAAAASPVAADRPGESMTAESTFYSGPNCASMCRSHFEQGEQE